MKKLLIACLLSFLPVSAKIIYVSPTQSGTADGSSFENSIGTIPSGLNAATSGDTLLLNNGEYTESFLIQKLLTRITIASQYLLTNDSSDVSGTIINCQSRDNGNMILSNAALDTTSAFIGITFQDLPDAGNVTSVYTDATATTGPKFLRCHFLRNIQCFGNGDILVDSCLFSGNGNILLSNEGSLQIRNSIIEKSSGVISSTQRLSMFKCEIRDNNPPLCLFSGHYKYFEETNFTGNGDSSSSATISYNGGSFDTTVFKNCVFNNDTAGISLFRDIFGVTFIGCKFYNNTITGDDGGLFYTCRNIQLRNCLIYANTGFIIDNQFSDYLATISGTTIADNDPSGIIRNWGTLNITNSIITDSISSETDAYYSLLKIDTVHLTSSSSKCIINRNPLFVNATAGDYHLMGYSPAIDAGSRSSSNLRENQNCYNTNDNQIIDMGFYGNTPEATCITKSTAAMTIIGEMRPNLYLNEIVYDTLIVKNASETDTIVTYDNDSVTSGIEGLTCTGVLFNYTVLKPGDSCFAYFRHEGKPGGNGGGSVNFGFNADPTSRDYYYSGTVSSKNFDDIFSNAWVCPATVAGSSTTSTFPFINLGNNPITITEITFSSSVLSQFKVVGKTCPFTIQPGDSVTFSVTFSPTAPVSYQIPIVISTPNIVGGVDNSLQFSSTGIQTDITVAPKEFTFGSVLLGETDSTKVLTIRNENQVTISISDITFDNPQFSVSGNTSFSLSAGDIKTLKVMFTPESLGLTIGILTIHNTSVLDSVSKVSLSGIGVEAGISLSETTIDFGNIPAGTFRDDSISVTNNGTGVLKIDTIISNDSNFLVLGNAGQRQVAPSLSFWLKVRFNPGNSTEALSEKISIVSNAQQSPHLITLTGTGTRSSLSAALSTINFGKRSLTSTSDTIISISNNGNALVTITDTNTTNAAFSIVSFPETIAAGANKNITIRFKSPVPSGGDFLGAAVGLAYTDGSEDGSISITLSGTAAAKPFCDTIKISPATVIWDTIGQVVFQASADDSDDAGTGARIAKYLWSSSIDGALSPSTSSFTLKPSDFSIGKHSITCRVIDNEGDTSATVTNSLTVTDRPPCAMISSITPDGLILKGSGSVIFSGRGWDQDQFAKNSYDSLKSFQWYSTVQGLLGSGKTLTINSSTLQLSNHGFYIKVVDNENSTACSDTLLVPVQAGIGRALIVAGTAFDDHTYFTKNIAPNCNWAYTKLLDRGFSHEQIYYMNPIGWQSLKDPYANSKIVDTTRVTLDVLRSFLLGDAVKKDVQNSIPLVLYLLGHGSSALNNGRFYLNKTEYLTPDTLAAWLDSYGDLPSTSQIIVILDFCYSGSYQSKLRTSYTQKRIVITSSDASTAAYFSNGKCFGWNLWNNVYQGNNLATTFSNALNWSNANAPGENKANPLLNCDNNSTHNSANDYEIARTVFIGGSQQLQALTSEIDSVTAEASEEGITIAAHLHGTFSTVWSRLYAPDFDPSAQQNTPSVKLTKVNDTLWSGVYTGSRIVGTYLIVTEGSDGDEKFVMGLPCEVVNDIAIDAENHPSVSRLPSVVFLGTAYPNPVAGKALISYGLPKAMKVQLSLYDLRGRLVARLVDANKNAGYHQALLNLQSNSRQVVSGNYICRLEAGRNVITRHLMVSR